MVGEDGLRDGGDPVGAAMEFPQVNYSHFDGIPDTIIRPHLRTATAAALTIWLQS
ncbi:hypothetical protein [Streptomyces niveus]|uniref:hypothetical protein n=1 Tax=Streptomyces niveus TaxID=193462 RepID=UPI0036CDE595